MRVLGLTGGIAMGKSTAAAVLRRAGATVFDADAAVRRLQAPGGAALPAIARLLPASVVGDRLDRGTLRRALAADPAMLPALEAVLHPLVEQELERFLRACRRRGARLAVLEVPLLFETGLDRLCDAVIAVSAPAAVQHTRLRRRATLNERQFRALIARQLPDAVRRRRADAVVPTGLSRR
ncbi:MAG: dephospho-CoA kinase, partial [Gluconacetobacter diazotrophicus]|nr:dephospho-CoA kinase [Gluconacetobacter diazotrophicus]